MIKKMNVNETGHTAFGIALICLMLMIALPMNVRGEDEADDKFNLICLSKGQTIARFKDRHIDQFNAQGQGLTLKHKVYKEEHDVTLFVFEPGSITCLSRGNQNVTN